MELLRLLFARRWLLIGFLVGIIILLLPAPDGLSEEGKRAIALLAVAIIFFITEPIPLPATALLIAVGQVLLHLGLPNEVARSFMSDSVFFIMGSLMISVAIVKQNLDKRIAFGLLRITGPKVGRIAFGITATSALLASFIGEHTVAAMMLPVTLGIIRAVENDNPNIRNFAVLLLLSIVYGCAIAGLGTPSGGARNAIIIDYWNQLFDIKMGYLGWMAYAYPLVLLQLPFVTWILLRTFKPEVLDVRRAIARLRQDVRKSGKFSANEIKAVVLFAFILIGWITLSSEYGLGMIAILGASLFMVFGLIRWQDLNTGVNWGVVWLYASAISLGFLLDQSGAATWLAGGVISILGGSGGLVLFIAIALLIVLFTNLMSSGAAVAVLAPITLQIAANTGQSEIAIGFITALGSAFAFLTVIGTPAAMIIYGSGYLKPADYARAGSKLVVVSVIMLIVLATLYWPILGL